jgi:peroxiredoxin/TolA-binding protein
MDGFGSGKQRARRQRSTSIRTSIGFLLGLLVGLAIAGISWAGFPAARSQGAQGAQGNDASYDSEFQKGLDLLRRKRYDDALKSFKRANEMRNRQSAECFYEMAQAYLALEAYKTAAESCDKTIEFSGNDKQMQAQAYNLKGIAVQAQADGKDQKKLQDAETNFRQGLALGTDLPILLYNLGFTLMQENRDAEGIAELKKYVELMPEGAKAEQALKLIENPRRAREFYAPDFSVTTSEGEYISLDDLRGKVVLLDFWGTWCPPCVASVPALRDLHKRYAKEKSFVMISVSSDGIEEKWKEFILKNQMDWPQYLDRGHKVQQAFDVHAFPSYILIDHEGIVRFRTITTSWERTGELDSAIKKEIKIIAKSAPTE